jgi:hypothetical protein
MKPIAAVESRLVRLALGFAAGVFVSFVTVKIPILAEDQVVRDSKAKETIVFHEVAAEAGVSFRFDNGSRGKHDLPEIMGGGVALFDADGDGRLDIYLCNGGPISASTGKPDSPCRLYCNRGEWHFEAITSRADAPGPGYAMGAAVRDYDGDGRADLS